jgi:hypothetical protein
LPKKLIDAVLWRSYLTSTSAALWGESTSQYYIDLPKFDYENFFGPSSAKGVDKEKNSVISVMLEPYEGIPAADRYELTFKKLREGTGRAGSWNMNGQHTNKAYPLWQQQRGPTKSFTQMGVEEKNKNFILILRDVDYKFHGRWIRETDFVLLPEVFQAILLSAPAGWRAL